MNIVAYGKKMKKFVSRKMSVTRKEINFNR